MRLWIFLVQALRVDILHVLDAIHKSREDYMRIKLKLKMKSHSLAKIRCDNSCEGAKG